MTGILIAIIIIQLLITGYLYRKNQELKKEISYWRQTDRMKDELKDLSPKV